MPKQKLTDSEVVEPESLSSLSASLNLSLSVQGIDGQVIIGAGVETLSDRTWVAITSSHLGKSAEFHQEVCRYLSRSMIDARKSRSVVLAAVDSAIEPWAKRAAEIYGVPLLLVRVNEQPESAGEMVLHVTGPELCRDDVVICLADRVDCVFVRSGGKIESAIRTKLVRQSVPCVRVAVHESSKHRKVAHSLMGEGAVGLYLKRSLLKQPNVSQKGPRADSEWTSLDGQWLIHCTRACSGAWPGQTERQYQDELLLSGSTTATGTQRTSMDTLLRILKSQRLAASALTSCRSQPVVCFSEQPLTVLLSRRSYRSHLHRWDYEPYGIAIRKSAAMNAGCQKVIYGDPEDRQRLSVQDRFRFQARGTTYDWTKEREWRFRGDVGLEQFDPDDIRVFVRQEYELERVASRYRATVVGSLARS